MTHHDARSTLAAQLLRRRAGGTLAAPCAARAGGWPTKPVTIVVPFPAGGGTDAFARPLFAVLTQEHSASQFVIDNRAAPAARSAPRSPRKAAPDGYTFFMGAVHHTIAPSMYPKLDYNLETDFVPVGLISSVPQVIVVNPQRVPVNDLKGLLELRAQEPRQAELRLGRQRHLAPPGRRAVQAADQDLHHPHPVPRRRPGAAGPDRRPGRHDVRRPRLVGRAHQGRAHQGARGGRATSARRASPTCPTAAEAGVPTYQVATWYGLWAPKGTPKEVVDRMQAEMQQGASRRRRAARRPGPAWAPRRPTCTATPSASSSTARSSAGPRWSRRSGAKLD